ncbi:MAG: hypothetical protein HZB42_07605 [Sphingobacteriales bacterium]|nr:hypothetical protein [Sphingobacteriales bacterium]
MGKQILSASFLAAVIFSLLFTSCQPMQKNNQESENIFFGKKKPVKG